MDKTNPTLNVQEFWLVTETGIVKVELSNKVDKIASSDFAKKLLTKKHVTFNVQEKRANKRSACSSVICQPFYAIHKLCASSKDVVVIWRLFKFLNVHKNEFKK